MVFAGTGTVVIHENGSNTAARPLAAWHADPSIAEKLAYMLAKVMTMQAVLVVGISSAKDDRRKLRSLILDGFTTLSSIGTSATLTSEVISPIKQAAVRRASDSELPNILSTFQIGVVNHFDYSAPAPVAIAFFARVLRNLADGELNPLERAISISDYRASVGRVMVLDPGVSLPPPLASVLGVAVSATDVTNRAQDPSNLWSWADALLDPNDSLP